jgi:4-hydroxy-3-polyprenylbenzoate decarboxylase
MPYGVRLLEQLLGANVSVYLLVSTAAQIVAKQEMDWSIPTHPEALQTQLVERYAHLPVKIRVFGREAWFAPVASGSNPADAMVICPCTMGTLAAVAQGMSDNLIERAADVCIKEQRKLIVVPRETPYSVLHLENMLKLARMGVVILPPNPGFYHQPKSVADMVDFVVARILDHLRIPHNLMTPWGE